MFRRKEVKVWYCTVCGHIEIGTEPPEVPVCEHRRATEIKADNFKFRRC
ncbi:MAG: rubredoxin-like domain-containing protein [Eggerthella lenta]